MQQKKPPVKIIDARNKIIQKNRMKFRDAREKLHHISRKTDARLKIMKKQKRLAPMIIGEDLGRQPTRKPQLSTRPVRRPSTHRPPTSHARFPTPMELDEASIFSLRRTVKNDITLPIHSTIPPFPDFGRSSRKSPPPFGRTMPLVSSDPFDCYEVPVRRPMDVSEPVNIQRKIYNIESDEMSRKGILRAPTLVSPTLQRRFVPDENSSLSYEMRSRLEHAPDPNESSGIFSRQQLQQQQQLQQSGTNGYRIVVSNLHASVSQGDIKELFEDIGELMEARLVRPGVAEVIFRTREDAEEAVDTYHNRHLDGQPMKCLLVQPRASSKPTAPALKAPQPHVASLRTASSSLPKTGSKTPLEIDIDALHKVLFRRN